MKKKSKFQERLEEVQKEHREAIDAGINLKLHNEEFPGDPDAHQSLTAQEPYTPNVHGNRGWFCAQRNPPPYYVPVDLSVGQDILEDWYRVSDGEKDYYCNQRDDKVIYEPKLWAKRTGVVYTKYDPMTTDDIKQITIRDLIDVMIKLENKKTTHSHMTDLNKGVNLGLGQAITVINDLISKKRMTGLSNTQIWN